MPQRRRSAHGRSIAAAAAITAAAVAVGLAAGCAKTDYSDTNEATTATRGAAGAAQPSKPGFVPKVQPAAMRTPVILTGAPH